MNLLQKISLGVVLAAAVTSAADAQIIVRIRPPRPAVIAVRPVAPSPRHVWIEEDWRAGRGNYEYNGGRWAEAPYAGARWVPGHWKESPRRGWVWRPGHWSR